jgi:hypothetical protein
MIRALRRLGGLLIIRNSEARWGEGTWNSAPLHRHYTHPQATNIQTIKGGKARGKGRGFPLNQAILKGKKQENEKV